eukprot:366180-Chlamydomonas_euryale.AAC.2
MIFGEEASPRRAADILQQPRALPALCRQLLRPQPNCRFLAACLLMRMLHAAADAVPDGEWGDDGDGDMAGVKVRSWRRWWRQVTDGELGDDGDGNIAGVKVRNWRWWRVCEGVCVC